jgi:flagellar basal-body rod modification protein FlgD
MDPIASSQAAATTAASAAQTPSASKAQDQRNQFLQLLVAQIKGQNPLNPMEGSEFVSQLAQFSSLEELTHMRATLDTVQELLSAQQQSNLTNQTQEIF